MQHQIALLILEACMPRSSNSILSPEVKAIFDKLLRLLDSDKEQINALPEPYRTYIAMGPSCDELPNARGEFGRTPSNPIPTNGPLGQVIYLSRLRTNNGCPIMFHRVRAEEGATGAVDAYEVLSLDGKVREVLYLSLYHPRKSKKVPRGYTYASKLDPDNLTYGVNHIVANFPEKLDAHIRKWQMDTLGIPLPVQAVRKSINGSPFHPSILEGSDAADIDSPDRRVRDDILKLLHASRDSRFSGQNIALGVDGLVRPIGEAAAPLSAEYLTQILKGLNGALTGYISVHNDMNRLQLRRIIPIPFVFSPIDFSQKAITLGEILNKLGAIYGWLSQQSLPGIEVPITYTSNLCAAVAKLREISDRLAKKGSGRSYRWVEFRADMAEYQRLVQNYYALGQPLNAWVAQQGLMIA